MIGCGAAVRHVELDAEVGVGTAGVVARRQDDAARRFVLSASQPLSPNNRYVIGAVLRIRIK